MSEPPFCSQMFGRQMRERGRGHIVLVGSLAAYQPTPLMAVYGAAKHFILALGEALQVELAPTVSVTVVSPGLMETEFSKVSGYTPKESLKISIMAARDVAEAGIDAMYKRKPSVVVGRLNQVAAFSTRFFSRHTQAKLVYQMSKD
jgi:uncharacterized protein